MHEWCVPISVDVTEFNFENLLKSQMKHSNSKFDVIMLDPPWQLTTN